MGILNFRIIPISLMLLLAGCEKMEMRGFIASYEDAEERFRQSSEWNSLHGPAQININTLDYKVFAMGDSHVGGTRNLELFFSDARESGAAAAVMVGDLTTGHAEDFNRFEAMIPPADSLSCFAVPGNHDLYFNGWDSYYELFGSSSLQFVVNTPLGSDLFICLDSGGGTLGSSQLEWVEGLLEQSREDYRHCTVFTHVNLFRFRPTASTNPFVEEIRELLDLFTRYHVEMVVNGHDHKRDSGNLGPTTYLIMDALLDGFPDASYLELHYSDQSIDYSFTGVE